MIRLLVRTAIALLASAIGLIVAAALLDGMTLNASGFVVAVVIFTLALAIFTLALALLQPFLASRLRRASSSVLGGVALIATLVSLIATALITDGRSISGIGTWIAAAVIVWLAAVLAAFILPFLGLEKDLEARTS